MTDTLDAVEVLIPRAVHDRRTEAIADLRDDCSALIDALPTATEAGSGPEHLAEAGFTECRAWIARVIRALPTRSDLEHNHGAA